MQNWYYKYTFYFVHFDLVLCLSTRTGIKSLHSLQFSLTRVTGVLLIDKLKQENERLKCNLYLYCSCNIWSQLTSDAISWSGFSRFAFSYMYTVWNGTTCVIWPSHSLYFTHKEPDPNWRQCLLPGGLRILKYFKEDHQNLYQCYPAFGSFKCDQMLKM